MAAELVEYVCTVTLKAVDYLRMLHLLVDLQGQPYACTHCFDRKFQLFMIQLSTTVT